MGESLISDAPSGINVSTLCHLVLKNSQCSRKAAASTWTWTSSVCYIQLYSLSVCLLYSSPRPASFSVISSEHSCFKRQRGRCWSPTRCCDALVFNKRPPLLSLCLCVCPAALGSSPARNRSESPSVQECLNRAGSAPHSRRRAGVNGRGSGSRPPSLSKPQGEALMNMLPLMSLLLMLERTDCRSASLALRCWNAGECCHSVICFYFTTWSSRGAPRLTQQEVI